VGISEFLKLVAKECSGSIELAIALIWFHAQQDHAVARSISSLAREIHSAGFPAQNVTRLAGQLSKDKRTTKTSNGFRIHAGHWDAVSEKLGPLLGAPEVKISDSVVEFGLFVRARGYTQKVVRQINASYDCGLYDCCAVMCRRLMETLIIEAYENKGEQARLKGTDGHYYMFSDLLAEIDKSNLLNIGRSSLQALKAFKKLGDLSAHNRRYNATKQDVDKVAGEMRIAAEELLHLADQT